MQQDIDKKNASEIYGVPGLKYKVDGKRYNARWEEMEFVERGVDGEPDIWRLKVDKIEPDPVKVQSRLESKVEEETPIFNWNMRKDDIMAELEKRNIVFDSTKTRGVLLKLLRGSV